MPPEGREYEIPIGIAGGGTHAVTKSLRDQENSPIHHRWLVLRLDPGRLALNGGDQG
jgi:hypothetical protein